MHSNNSDRNKHFQLVKRMRGLQTKKSLAVLQTPAGKYFGSDTLEGFASDAELLGKFIGESPEYDNEFYRLCKADNSYIFEFKGENTVRIPPMTLSTFEDIIFKKMKRGKACNFYQLTVEHLQHCGDQARLAIFNLLNRFILNIF